MTEIPDFFQKFKPKVAPAPIEKVVKQKTFTHRDWEVLMVICASADEDNNAEVSNSSIGKQLGMTNGAVSGRIKRLVEHGCLSVSYENSTSTHAVNRRFIHVEQIPDEPWTGNAK